MGMDVYGSNPKNPQGDYFRANVWFWRPLWSYAVEMFPDLVGDDPEDGFFNSGYGLRDMDAADLGEALLKSVADGTADEFRLKYYADLADLDREDCVWCDTTGIRTDDVGIKAGQHEKALEPEIASLVGREFGWCNGCNGIGTRPHFLHNYPFEIEIVKEFGEFLVASGGFEIW